MPVSLTHLAGMVVLATIPLALLPSLPSATLLMIASGLVLLALMMPWRTLWYVALSLLFFIWTALHGNQLTARINALSAKNVNAAVTITDVQSDRERVQVRLLRVNDKLIYPPLYAHLYRLPVDLKRICPGQRWQMRLHLRPVHSRLNEGGFDSQRYALANATPLQGTVLQAESRQINCNYRWQIKQLAGKQMSQLRWSGVLSALAFGDRSRVDKKTNQLMRETGTAHLMAISGLHIGLAAALGWIVGRGIQLLLPAIWIGYRLPLGTGLLLALVYSWLSGGNPPAMRAILAITIWNSLRLAGWQCRGLQVWLFCIAALLFTDPVSILSDSLLLSAAATGGLLLWYRLAPLPASFYVKWRWGWLRLLHLQFGIMLMMLPLQAVLFHGFSVSSMVANLWAVPVVSMVTVPLILVAICLSFSTMLAEKIWWLADQSLSICFLAASEYPQGMDFHE